VLWSVFFLVPTGRATQEMQISPGEAEAVMKKMAQLSVTAPFDVKSTAAPHFRRVLIQSVTQGSQPAEPALDRLNPQMRLGALRSYQGVTDGRGVVFVSHTGDIYPSGFLPILAGNVRRDHIADVYRDHELFKALRDPDRLKGKCGRCRFRIVCGGSRGRAWGQYQDYLAEDGLCCYVDQPGNPETL
jgi:AdoMet-dependent heme synthase